MYELGENLEGILESVHGVVRRAGILLVQNPKGKINSTTAEFLKKVVKETAITLFTAGL